MKLELSADIELPPGWRFGGLWIDHYDKEKQWTADVEYMQSDSAAHPKTLLSVESRGDTAQEALDGIPAAIENAINVIVTTETWVKDRR